MLLMLIVMLVIVALAGLIVAFVAFPHRGQDMPVVPWLGGAMSSAADAMPTLDPEPAEQPGAPADAATALIGWRHG